MLDSGFLLSSEHTAYAKKIAGIFCRKYRLPPYVQELFESDACFALCRAAARYDPAGGASFKTFAFQWIRGAMCERVKQERRAREIDSKVPEMLRMSGVRICPTFDTADGEIGSDLCREEDCDLERQMMGREAVALLKQLPDDVRRVLELRLLEDRTIADVAARLNIPPITCSRLESEGLAKLKRLLTGKPAVSSGLRPKVIEQVRRRRRRGSPPSPPKLERVEAIRTLVAAGWTQTRAAALFGITPSAVCQMLGRRSRDSKG